MDIDPIEFGKLCANVQTIHDTVKEMDVKLDGHHDKITSLESTRSIFKKGVKWVITGISAGFAFLTWALS